MDIAGKLSEISSIEKELKQLRINIKTLNARKKTLITELTEYHKSIGEDSFKYKGKTYYIEQKTISTRKNNKDQIRDASRALEEYGLYGEEARNVINAVKTSLKGPAKIKEVLK